MLDLKITDVFTTLCVGVVSVICIMYVYFLSVKLFVKDKFNKDEFTDWLKHVLQINYKETGYAIFFSVVIYVAGIVVGDLTDHLTDSDAPKSPFISYLKDVSSLPLEGDLRRQSLIKESGDLTGLGTAVFRSSAILQNANASLETGFFNESPFSKTAWKAYYASIQADSQRNIDFQKFISEIYYTAKNWSFSTDKPTEVLNELKGIQDRIDFFRSVVLLTVFCLQIVILLFAGYYLLCLYKFLVERKRLPHCNPVLPILVFTFGFLLSREGYKIAEGNYNERAFGYYVSHINEEARKQAKQENQPPQNNTPDPMHSTTQRN